MISGLTILVIGFFLGMRHATDPDHVVAVSTIISREPSIGRAGWIGALWGLGHTATILLVGAAIMLFNVAIPTRVGLTMEFTVGVMLILLGVLNLTGFTGWLSENVLAAYTIYLGRYSTSRTWSSIFVLEYRDHNSFGLREATVAKVREKLKSDPSWLAASQSKQKIRVEKQTVIAEELLPQ